MMEMQEKKYRLINYSFILLALVIAAMIFGTVIIISVEPDYMTKQIFGVCCCVVGLIVVSLIDYKFICKYYMILYVINIILLVLILILGQGSASHGADRWFVISDSFTIQPSEFSKIILIICTAVFLDKHHEDLNKAKTLLKLAVYLAVPIALIVAEPDLSTTLCLVFTLIIVIFVGGLSLKLIGIVLLILIPCAGGFLWYIQQEDFPQFLKTYQINRILDFVYSNNTTGTQDQQNNSVMAIGSGQLSGKGINNQTVATVKDANLISEQQTDFIFSAIGEELGFIGSVIVIAILALIVLQCIRVAKRASDKRGMYIATGIGSLIAIQTFINIGVATAILPNTGIPLPFFSYGLSSLVSISAGIGLVLNINLQKKNY